ncbi:MAG: hypothetical protein IT176_04645 [Acidobacteria bacterium]|nr:hypothetical protein [Acidobacteriota bacterium]
MTGDVVDLTGISRSYGALRPLRIEHLAVGRGESVAILGLDRGASEIFVNLVTGATLPESGSAAAFGTPTAGIADSDAWLAFADRFGIVSERAVLLDSLSPIQNISMPFTLEIEPPPGEVRTRATVLAREAGLPEALLDRAVGELDPIARARVRVARALALAPEILLVEHLSAGMARSDAASLGGTLRATAARRGIAIVTLTADRAFAAAIADRVLTHEAATGRLRPAGPLGWLRHRLG